MKKIYLDCSETNCGIIVYIKDREVVPAGTSVCSMPGSYRNDKYLMYENECDLYFIFDNAIPEVNFYTVPFMTVFAVNKKGDFFASSGYPSDDEPVYLITGDRRCFTVADGFNDFLRKVESDGIDTTKERNDVVFYDSLKDAAKYLDFFDLPPDLKVNEDGPSAYYVTLDEDTSC